MKVITGGVTAAKGFQAASTAAGIKYQGRTDMAMVYSEKPCVAAGTFTTNIVKAAPVKWDQEIVYKHPSAQVIVCNSGIANTCAADGIEKAEAMCAMTAEALGLDAGDVLVASTGVIGPSINLEPIRAGLPGLVAELSANGSHNCAEAIMTTDTRKKEFAVQLTLGGKACILGGIAKGSGMIAPNMATMLCFLTTDAAIDSALLQDALHEVVGDTFNMMTVDGDTSTNDMVVILANGAAGNAPLREKNADYRQFVDALHELAVEICRALAADGEGATKLVECRITGAASVPDARIAAKAVVSSSLMKAAMFGADANWGRALCAIGYSGAAVDVKQVDMAFVSAAGRVEVCRGGAGIPFSEEEAKKVLTEPEITLDIRLHDGDAAATAWGCDLTYDYVKINGDYRT